MPRIDTFKIMNLFGLTYLILPITQTLVRVFEITYGTHL